jgi:rare lipoprotein A
MPRIFLENYLDFNVLSTQNWSRMFNVWIEDIQVVCHPVVHAPFQIQHCFLRKVRMSARYTSLLVMLLFSLHCTRPRVEWVQRGSATPVAEIAEVPVQAYEETGAASWYGDAEDGFIGLPTASGELYQPSERTCAHRTLPFGTLLDVENLASGKRTMVRVNDRGPFLRGRILDLSRKAAGDLGMRHAGVASVRIRTVDAQGRPAALDPSSAGDPYTVQVAALTDPVNIRRLAQSIEPMFGRVTLLDATGRDGAEVKQVRVGSYPRLEEAHQAADKIARFLKDRNVEPFVTRRR